MKENQTLPSDNSNDEEKRKKIIFRRCGKNWVPGHRCASNHLYHCKIINGKEVEVVAEEDMLDSNEDENHQKCH
jgi:hypothetical protein